MGSPTGSISARSLAGGLFAMLLLAAVPARPADCVPTRAGWDAPEQRLGIERHGRDETLLIEGRIDADLPARLETLLARHPDIGTVSFNASGDDRASAMAAGLILRSKGIFEVPVPAGASCIDACALLFLSGGVRSVDPSAVFDLGRFYEPTSGSANAADVARQSLDISNYLIRMGVSRRLLADTLDRDAALPAGAARRCLTPAELHGYNVANWNE